MSPRPIPVSAPGKLFLLGEYAVLGGGPALVTSVDRHVRIRPRNDDEGYQVKGADFSDPIRLPAMVRRVLREEEGIEVDPNRLTCDVSEFFEGGTKLGLGSSAASAVALIASTAPRLSARRRFELAWEVHRRFQGGVGSGADIAASTFGTTVAFHLHQFSPPFDELNLPGLTDPIEPVVTDVATIETGLTLPQQLRVDAVWTGESARSVSFIDGLKRALKHHSQSTKAILKSITSRARVGIAALRQDDAQRFIDAVETTDRNMERLGDLTGLPIITNTHRRIRALAHASHCVAKPSGAGGGDFTLLVGPSDAPIPASIENDYLVLSVL